MERARRRLERLSRKWRWEEEEGQREEPKWWKGWKSSPIYRKKYGPIARALAGSLCIDVYQVGA